MKKYILKSDGSQIQAANASDFVQKLIDSSRFASHESPAQFRDSFAAREWPYSEKWLDPTSDEAFLQSLIVQDVVVEVVEE